MQTTTFMLPQHWACALINDDPTGLDVDDLYALHAFTADVLKEHGQCWALDCGDEPSFMQYHDAQPYGVLACDCLEFTFDITPRA